MEKRSEDISGILVELDSITETFFRYKNKLMEKKYDEFPSKMNLNKYQILKAINESDQCIVADLVKKLELTSGATTLILNKLEEEELITRSRTNTDRRLVYLELTELGKTVYRTITKQREDFLLTILGPLNMDEKHEFVRLFKKIANGLDEYGSKRAK